MRDYINHSSGFTLLELLVVIAIMSLLSSTVLASLSGARESARDTRRIADINQFRTAVQAYKSDTGEWPGEENNRGVQASADCKKTDIYKDLVGGGYLQEMPTDPSQSVEDCQDVDSGDISNDDFFYGWDSAHCCEGAYCISINNVETQGALKTLNNQYLDRDNNISNGVQFVTDGGNANIGTGDDFNYCFVDQT